MKVVIMPDAESQLAIRGRSDDLRGSFGPRGMVDLDQGS